MDRTVPHTPLHFAGRANGISPDWFKVLSAASDQRVGKLAGIGSIWILEKM